jgi:oxalate/formate antiporter
VITALSWLLAAQASSLTELYLTYGLLGGVGTGIIYVGVVGHVVQWFPDRRGLATGLVAAGYGFGAIITTFPIDSVIRHAGYPTALRSFGVLFGVVGVIAAQALRRPATPGMPPPLYGNASGSGRRSFSPTEMLKTPLFWLMFGMMAMMSTSGLMVNSQLGAFTTDFGMARVLVFGLPLVPLALSVDRITNGVTRPFFGWVSDQIGRETTMVIAFALEGAAMTAWLFVRHNPVLFVAISGLVFFGWGEIFSLFPSILTDTFGSRHATSNYGFLYMAQGVGSVLGGPLAALLHQRTGSWLPVFSVVIAMNFASALLAHFGLRPRRHRWLEAHHAPRSVTKLVSVVAVPEM